MRSNQLELSKYKTDKIESEYLEVYDRIFDGWVDKELSILELGIRDGGSLELWRDYFPKATVTGIDIKLPALQNVGPRIKMFEGSQANVEFLKDVAASSPGAQYDIVIDDASHVGELTKRSFWYLFDNHLRAGGIYVIEDWGTGYWSDWPDGRKPAEHRIVRLFPDLWARLLFRFNVLRMIPFKARMRSHQHGMVGFIKELVDEQGASDVSKGSMGGKALRRSRFEKIIITPHIVFVHKQRSIDRGLGQQR